MTPPASPLPADLRTGLLEPDGPAAALAAGRCPFCASRFERRAAQPRCPGCGAPLTPAPGSFGAASAVDAWGGGRRVDPRFAKEQQVLLWRPGAGTPQPARLCDLSLTGLSLAAAEPALPGSVLRVQAAAFDALVQVVASRRAGAGVRVHARMLTLQREGAAQGVFLSLRA